MRMRHVVRRSAPMGAVAATAATIAVLVPPTPSPVVPPAGDGTVSIGILRTSAGSNPGSGGPRGNPTPGRPTFGVRVGSLTGLSPGVTRTLPVDLHNPFRFDISVVSYAANASVTAVGDGAAGCSASDLVLPIGTVTLDPPRFLPAGGRNDLTIPVTLSSKAPPACQNVVFTVTVTATAVNR